MLDRDHLASLKPKTPPLSRRALFKTSLSAGFCAAVSPVWAQAISTPSVGLIAGEVKIASAGFDVPSYRAMPDKGGPFPVVLVIPEIFGVHEYIKDVCRRWAKLGYYALAMELSARQGDASAQTDIGKLMGEIIGKIPDAQVAADLDAGIAYAAKSGSGDVARAAVTGFCWGGRQSLLYAAHNPSLKAAVAWYGPLGGAASELRPKSALELAPTIKVPVLGLYGAKDGGIPADQVAQLRSTLDAAGKGSKIIVYDDAGHAFHADYRPSYVKADAEASWKEATAWLKGHGV